MSQSFWDKADVALIMQLDAVLSDVSGSLAPFDPYLHWSLNRRAFFLPMTQVQIVREYVAGLFVVQVDECFYVARKFMNTNGWFWSCVPLIDAQPDDRMLRTMMDGAT